MTDRDARIIRCAVALTIGALVIAGVEVVRVILGGVFG
jgi:hypothetical protein